MNAFDAAFGTGETTSGDDVRASWRDLVGPDGSAELVVTDVQEPVAYVERFPHRGALNLDGYVHPRHTGRGVGSAFLRLAEERARELGLARAKSGTLHDDAAATSLFEANGWRLARAFFRMAIDVRGDEQPPEAPEGITVRTFREGDLERFHAASEDAFADHWDHAYEPLDEFVRKAVDVDEFDPTLWWLAFDGPDVAGVLRATPKRFDAGWIDRLGVRPQWRRRGLGEVLLRTALAEFARRGEKRVALGVDAQNPTGATQLYEKAGMHVAWRSNVFAKEIVAPL